VRKAAAIVGIGRTRYYGRGQSSDRSEYELAYEAIFDALADAGLQVDDIDGFAMYSGGLDTSLVAQTLGIPEVRFTATVTGGGGGSAGSVGLASAAIVSGMAEVVVSVMSLQQANHRLGAALAPGDGSGPYAAAATSASDFTAPSGLLSPGQGFALMAMRHMYQYGTTREHFAEVAISARRNAATRPTALKREALTLEDYFEGRMISDPMCLFDFCLESEGAVAVITTSSARAATLRQKPAYILGAAQGGAGRWGQAIKWLNMPDEYFTSSGHQTVARQLYAMAGITPQDVDVALIYDHFTPMVLMQLEDYGFCARGESGPFVADGAIRWPNGSIPVNTHGGNLSEAYILGMTHIYEAVEQLRGTAVNQVAGAEVALVTGGPAPIPVSGLVLSGAR
jgi:acetyl-CoA acetyltransferase